MTNFVSKGARFSLLYLRPDRPIEESKRLRNRLLQVFKQVAGKESKNLGHAIERELGVRIVKFQYDYFVDWHDFSNLEMRDFLDTVTICREFATGLNGIPSRATLVKELNRIFSEETSAYVVDDQLGVHPSVDPSFRAILDSAVRGLGGADFEAVRLHLEKADLSLLPKGDRRDAVRSIFDAVENVFKQTFQGAISINTGTIQTILKPTVERIYQDEVERRTALKLVESLKDWVDGCHNYRHEAGKPEPAAPPEELAVLMVSNGIAFTRWLVDIRMRQNT